MSSTSTNIVLEDPFPQVQQEVRTRVIELQRGLAIGGGSSRESQPISVQERKRQITHVEQDVNDLRMALDIARTEPERFRLTTEQLNERARFIDDMARSLQTLRHNITTNNQSTTRAPSSTNIELRNQEMMLQEQDEELDDLANAVERIGNLGRDMHEELQSQGQMLDDLGGRFDTTLSRMKAVRQRVENFMQQTGRSHFCTIVWLLVAFIATTILIVVT